jgi:uncharacterized protein YjiS (DUF1127 family)
MLTILDRSALASRDFSHHAAAVVRLLSGAVQALPWWIERRRQLRALADLDDHLLRDVGLAREDVQRACSQSFWMR